MFTCTSRISACRQGCGRCRWRTPTWRQLVPGSYSHHLLLLELAEVQDQSRASQLDPNPSFQPARHFPRRCCTCSVLHFHLSRSSYCVALFLGHQGQLSHCDDALRHFDPFLVDVVVEVLCHQGPASPLLPPPSLFSSDHLQDLASFSPPPSPGSPSLSARQVSPPGLSCNLGSPAACTHSPSSLSPALLVDLHHFDDLCFAPLGA